MSLDAWHVILGFIHRRRGRTTRRIFVFIFSEGWHLTSRITDDRYINVWLLSSQIETVSNRMRVCIRALYKLEISYLMSSNMNAQQRLATKVRAKGLRFLYFQNDYEHVLSTHYVITLLHLNKYESSSEYHVAYVKHI